MSVNPNSPEVGSDDLKQLTNVLRLTLKELDERVNAIGVDVDIRKSVKSLVTNFVVLADRVEAVADFSLATRIQSVYSNHSLEYLNYSFERKCADIYAHKQSLLAMNQNFQSETKATSQWESTSSKLQ